MFFNADSTEGNGNVILEKNPPLRSLQEVKRINFYIKNASYKLGNNF